MPILTVSIEYSGNVGVFSPTNLARVSPTSRLSLVAQAMTAQAGDMITALRSNIIADGVRASGTWTNTVAVPAVNDTVAIGGRAYRFVTTLSAPFDVRIGATIAATRDNLVAAINGTGVVGTTYSTGTLPNPNVFATPGVAAGVANIFAMFPGTAGNAITLAEAGANTVVSGATLTGGTNGTLIV
jgi:hypothetical protein